MSTSRVINRHWGLYSLSHPAVAEDTKGTSRIKWEMGKMDEIISQ